MVILRRPKKNFWVGEDIGRKRRLGVHFLDHVRRFGRMNDLKQIQLLILNDQQLKAVNKFRRLIDDVSIEIPFSYIVREGRILEFMSMVLKERMPKLSRKQILKQVKTLEKVKTTRRRISREKGKRIFGINKKGKRSLARFEILTVKRKPSVRLRDVKTGKFLKQTKSFKKRFKK